MGDGESMCGKDRQYSAEGRREPKQRGVRTLRVVSVPEVATSCASEATRRKASPSLWFLPPPPPWSAARCVVKARFAHTHANSDGQMVLSDRLPVKRRQQKTGSSGLPPSRTPSGWLDCGFWRLCGYSFSRRLLLPLKFRVVSGPFFDSREMIEKMSPSWLPA